MFQCPKAVTRTGGSLHRQSSAWLMMSYKIGTRYERIEAQGDLGLRPSRLRPSMPPALAAGQGHLGMAGPLSQGRSRNACPAPPERPVGHRHFPLQGKDDWISRAGRARRARSGSAPTRSGGYASRAAARRSVPWRASRPICRGPPRRRPRRESLRPIWLPSRHRR